MSGSGSGSGLRMGRGVVSGLAAAGALVMAGGLGACEGQNDPAQAVTGSAQAARKSQVLQELRQIAMSMQTDQMMGSGWPSAEEARNGALQGMQDAWGEPYQYEPPEDSRGTPKLFSKGKDRQAGTDDDIVFENWQDLGG